jgi:hypothetical protein
MKSVTKISKARFRVVTPEIANSKLVVNFNPIIDEFNLKGNFYLIHWQARPKGYRQWGIYSSKDDTYTSTEQPPKSHGLVQYLMLNDRAAYTIPSAVVLFLGDLNFR